MKVAQPRSLEQATVLAERRAAIAAAVAGHEADRQEQLAAVNAVADVVVAPLVEEGEAIALALELWWAKAGPGLLKGKRKSMEIGGCKIGTRTSAERVEFAHGDDKAALAAVVEGGLKGRATTTKRVLDKVAIAAALKGKSTAAFALKALGFQIGGGEETFFVTPVDAGDAKVSAR